MFRKFSARRMKDVAGRNAVEGGRFWHRATEHTGKSDSVVVGPGGFRLGWVGLGGGGGGPGKS